MADKPTGTVETTAGHKHTADTAAKKEPDEAGAPVADGSLLAESEARAAANPDEEE